MSGDRNDNSGDRRNGQHEPARFFTLETDMLMKIYAALFITAAFTFLVGEVNMNERWCISGLVLAILTAVAVVVSALFVP